MGARGAHNPEVGGSKPLAAIFCHFYKSIICLNSIGLEGLLSHRFMSLHFVRTALCRNILAIRRRGPNGNDITRYTAAFSTSLRGYSSCTETPVAEGSAGPETLESVKNQMIEKDKQLKELKDSYLLALADMENLRHRAKRDNEASSLFAIQKFSKDIISVADILEMALTSVGPMPADAAATPAVPLDAEKKLADLIAGLSMTLAELHKAFQKHGLTAIDPMHQKFNPNEHNALFETPSDKVDPGTIINVQKKGYMLYQRVIRPADVGVARKP